jgi:hypothetical protein
VMVGHAQHLKVLMKNKENLEHIQVLSSKA